MNTLAWNNSCYPEDIQVRSLLAVGLEPLRRRTVTILMDRHIVNICRTVPSQTTRLLMRIRRFLTGRSSIARSYCLERTSTCKCKPRHIIMPISKVTLERIRSRMKDPFGAPVISTTRYCSALELTIMRVVGNSLDLAWSKEGKYGQLWLLKYWVYVRIAHMR